ncbi:MAG: alkaline phosphatase family protein, partial [Candidatus Methylomirabilis sp.]|nr:alkaline phosphatase family protein [Deltaproteobacteria bacterium]
MNTVFFSDAATRGLTRRMADGDPALYVDFPAFDEMSHEYGPGPEAFGALKDVDRNLEILLDAADHDQRPYNVVILSDHGQTGGVHFQDLYGRNLRDHVQSLLPTGSPEVVSQDFGSAAHLYLGMGPQAADRSAIRRRYPALLQQLRTHPGIAFTVTRQGSSTLIEGPAGAVIVTARRTRVVGTDPLAPFGGDPREIHHLAHREGAGDVMVFGREVNGRLVDFSVLPFRGLHGGFGQGQDVPFVIHPAGMPLEVERTADLYGQLARQRPH